MKTFCLFKVLKFSIFWKICQKYLQTLIIEREALKKMTAYLPEGLIIKAILVLGWSPKLQPDKESFKQGDETYKGDGALTVPAAGIEVKAYL